MRMQQRRKTAATWTSTNEQLLDGELGIESDTGKWKVGDGTTLWNGLAYQPSNAGITAAISAAVNGLVNGAPGAVDTLKELADALGDDPNFATTVTNALAAKANTSTLAPVATAGTYASLTGKPTLGTAAAAATTDFDAAGAATTAQAYAVQRGNHTGTQPASTVTGLATVATTGNIVDLVGNPFSFLTTGQETFPRMLINTASISATSGTARFTYFTARKSETVTQIRALCLNASAGTAPTLVRFGLYSVNTSTGALTLIASTANDTTVFASTGSTAFTKAFTAGVALTAGTRYAVTHLVVTTGTAPSVMGYGSGLGLSSESAMSPRIVGALTTQTDLPSSVTDAALGNSSTSATYYVLLP